MWETWDCQCDGLKELRILSLLKVDRSLSSLLSESEVVVMR